MTDEINIFDVPIKDHHGNYYKIHKIYSQGEHRVCLEIKPIHNGHSPWKNAEDNILERMEMEYGKEENCENG